MDPTFVSFLDNLHSMYQATAQVTALHFYSLNRKYPLLTSTLQSQSKDGNLKGTVSFSHVTACTFLKSISVPVAWIVFTVKLTGSCWLAPKVVLAPPLSLFCFLNTDTSTGSCLLASKVVLAPLNETLTSSSSSLGLRLFASQALCVSGMAE